MTGALVDDATSPDGDLRFDLFVTPRGNVRFVIDELNDEAERYHVQDTIMPEQDVRARAHAAGEPSFTSVKTFDADGGHTDAVVGGASTAVKVRIEHKPVGLTVWRDDVVVLRVNGRGLFHYDYRRSAPAEGEDWSEKFGSHTDSRPRGPMSLGVDVAFVGAEHVYGIPEHATSLSLGDTRGALAGSSEPYRLYNLDVFEYETDSPFGLYGSVPFMQAQGPNSPPVGFLWLNAAETYVDVGANDANDFQPQAAEYLNRVDTHWFSETGVMDMTVFLGPTWADIFDDYTATTGRPQLPPRFSTGHHQCRWNYKDEADVAQVDAGFNEHDIPYDVLWLDIEHTNGKRYFTWDATHFPDPATMQDKVAANGRKMVCIVDPHLKKDKNYAVQADAERLDLLVKKADGESNFDGWCWPGSSSYIDFLKPAAREFWASKFSLDQWHGATGNLYVWNDMNEPSVFNGPEVTMQKDNMHDGGVEHRDVHNIYGTYFHRATFEGGFHMRSANDRPFVLSRAFFAGSQRYGAIWTGDNGASWDHLDIASPMLMTIGMAGIPFIGADVGGFFGNPSTELLVRWYQAGAFYPFFRAHAHLDTDRREPWLFGEPSTGLIREAIAVRYRFLPTIYSLFADAHLTGMPILRPLFVQFPNDARTYDLDTEFLVGDALLVRPVTKEGAQSVSVYLPGSAGTDIWYDYESGARHEAGVDVTVETPLHRIPIFGRGGSIIVQRLRMRRSSALMEGDPYTIVVFPDANGNAEGNIYLDDGATLDHGKGAWARHTFKFANGKLQSTVEQGSLGFTDGSTIERVIVYGTTASTSASKANGSPMDVSRSSVSSIASFKQPGVDIDSAWELAIRL